MKKLSLALVSSLILVGCGGGGGSDSKTNTTKTAQVVDGYITGATVCIDLNNNSICDNGDENITETNNSGEYTYDSHYDNYNQLIIGGEDNVTNTQNTDILIKPKDLNTSVINPFTTLVANYMKEENSSLNDAIQKVANVMGINENDIIKNPLNNPTLAKKVSELNIIKSLTKSNFDKLAQKLKNSTTLNDLGDNNQTITDLINKIDTNTTANPEDLEKYANNLVSEINNQNNEELPLNSIKTINFDGKNPAYVDLNLTKGTYIFTAESATKNPYTIQIDSKNIEANNQKIYDNNGNLISNDVNITGMDSKDIAPYMVIKVDNNESLKIPLYAYNQQNSLTEANLSTSIVSIGYTPKYSHDINITDTVKNTFLYRTQVDEYYTFDINSTTAGSYELNVYGVKPNPLGTFAVKLTDGAKTLIDNDIEDDFNYTSTVTLESGKTYTLTISITNSKLPTVRNDYTGNYEIKFIKK